MSYSAIILAGGKGRRMGCREKALVEIDGEPMIKYVIDAVEDIVDNIIISVRDRMQGELFQSILPGYVFAYDIHENIGPLAGIYSGLMNCRDEYCFIAACDMPYINKDVVTMLFEKCICHDAIVPQWDDGSLEPLHAVYRREAMFRETKHSISRGENIIIAPILRLDVSYVNIQDIKKMDPDLKTFKNINTPVELIRIN